VIPKSEQRKMKDYLKTTEGLIKTHIVHLADKTKKDTGYNKKIINEILKESIITLKYDIVQQTYGMSVRYKIATTTFAVDTIELGELFNKAKIIANENMNKEDELDDYQISMVEFNQLNREITDFTNSLGSLRDLGIINYKFDDLIIFLNETISSNPIFQTNDSGFKGDQNNFKELIINYKKANNDSLTLKNINIELKKLYDRLYEEVSKYYSQDCYLFTYFYGKKLYYLIEFLKGRLNEQDAQEVLKLISEAFPDNSIDFGSNYNISMDLKSSLKDVYNVLKMWSRQLAPKDRIKLNSSSMFLLKKIVVAVNPIENKFKMMIKIMADAQDNLFSLSQVLFCRKETTKNEVSAFLKRALLDPFKRIYFILNIQILDYSLLLDLRNIINKVIEFEGENVNYNLLIFADKTEYHKDLLENDNFCQDFVLENLNSLITDNDIRNKYSHIFTTNQIVMSNTAGMGKSMYIKGKCKEYESVDLFMSGELNKVSVTKRLNNLSKSAKGTTKLAINVKLDFIEDFSIYSELVDFTMFCLCLLGRYYTDKGVRDLRDNLKLIFLEIGNTYSKELMAELNTLKLFNFVGDESNKMHKYKVIAKDFSIRNILLKNSLASDDQIVGNFLNALDNGSYKESNLKDAMSVIPKDRFHDLLEKYFMIGKSNEEKTKITYAQYQFWLKAMALMVKEVDQIEGLNPDQLRKAEISLDFRTELAEEMNLFAAQIINMSVNQAKSSQNAMKDLMSNLSREDLKRKKIEEYKDKSVKLDPWDSTTLLIPLLLRKNLLIAHSNFEVFNKKDTLRYRKRIHMKNFIRAKKTYVDYEKNLNSSELYLKNLCDVLNLNFQQTKEACSKFKGGKGFSITKDNYMKICLILLKAELKVPIIMMGESGCGKTYVSQFVSSVLLGEELRELTLYSGVTEGDLVAFMKSAIVRANELKTINKRVWVFFDEFNTSCLQSIVAEIMLDRICPIDLDIYNIPENIIFISCCNPYRMKTKKSDVGLVPKTTDNLLSHRVYPIPERLINFIWDFGQLSDEDEYKHLVSIIQADNIFKEEEQDDLRRFCNMVYCAHKFVRDIEERSGVSLRDIKRVLVIYKWFSKTLKFYEIEVQGKKVENRRVIHLNASIASIMVCYGLRLNGRPEQVELMNKLVDSVNVAASLTFLSKKEIKSILSIMAERYLNEVNNLNMGIIPDGIALNAPLKENFITMLACFDTLTPLIICGAPGTSKTLCTQIFNSALTPNVIKNCKIFSSFKGINAMYYGGSQTSTSEGYLQGLPARRQVPREQGRGQTRRRLR
jgi:hypothetical protein